jgi:hypothetical protein
LKQVLGLTIRDLEVDLWLGKLIKCELDNAINLDKPADHDALRQATSPSIREIVAYFASIFS